MPNVRIHREWHLEIEGPFNAGATAVGPYGIDAPSAETVDGRALIPYPEIHGLAADMARTVAPGSGVPSVAELFGRDAEGDRLSPNRARLWFGDGVLPYPRMQVTLPRIRGDARTMAAEDSALLMIGSPLAPGEVGTFTGSLTYWVDSAEQDEAISEYVLRLMRLVTSYGAYRGIGFGRPCSISWGKREERRYVRRRGTPVENGRVPIAVTVDRPFVNTPFEPVLKNLYRAVDDVSGGTLIGALAQTLLDLAGATDKRRVSELDAADLNKLPKECQDLATEFDKVRLLFAVPCPPQGQRMPPPPRSLAATRDGTLVDWAGVGVPALIDDHAVAFQPDWKQAQWTLAREAFPRADVMRELRVRTRMQLSQRVSEEGALFATELLIPGSTVWRGALDLSDVEASKRASVADAIVSLLALGIGPLGRTKAIATLAPEAHGRIDSERSFGREGAADTVVTFCTPTAFVDPDVHREAGALQAYDAAWREVSGGAFCLKTFGAFYRESLVGGDYLARRFSARSDEYQPIVLTQPGSTFVLQRTGAKSKASCDALLDDWVRKGIDPPSGAMRGWQSSGFPLSRQNGYGEVVVNQALPESIRDARELSPTLAQFIEAPIEVE